MGAHNGNFLSLLLVMLVSLLQMPFSCSFLLLAVNLIFQGVRVAPDLHLWQSQKMKSFVFFGSFQGDSLQTSFLGLVEVGDRSQTALFRSGQYNYHWIHHHFSHNWSWPTWREGSENAVHADVDTTLDYTISHKNAIYCSILQYILCTFRNIQLMFLSKTTFDDLILESSLIPQQLFSCLLCFNVLYPFMFAHESQDIETAGCIVASRTWPQNVNFGTAKARPWSCPAHRQAAGTSKPQMVAVNAYN